jgi:hypothetical protein
MSDAAEKGSVMLYGVSLAYEESVGDRGVQHGVARAFSMCGGSSFVLIRLSTGDSFIHCTARVLPLGCTALPGHLCVLSPGAHRGPALAG